MKKLSKILAISFILLLFGLVIGYFIGLPILEKWTKEKAITSLSEQVGAQVEIKKIKIYPFKQKVIIESLQVTNPYKPTHNALAFNQAELNFDLKKYWDDQIVYLKQGNTSQTTVDKRKMSNKTGWVDRKRYPLKKEESLTDKIQKVDLKALRDDFKNNFLTDLKKTKIFKNYEGLYLSLKLKVESDFPEKIKSIENDYKKVKAFKASKQNIPQALEMIKELTNKYKTLKNEKNEIQSSLSQLKHYKNQLNGAQAQILERFLSRHGLSDLSHVIQEQIQRLFQSHSQKTASEERRDSQNRNQNKKIKTHKTKRDDVLFYVKSLKIRGKEQNIKGEVKDFHNLNGEDFDKWLGQMSLKGTPEKSQNIELAASRLSNTDKQWKIFGTLKNFSLTDYNLISFGQIAQGLIDIELKSSYGKKSSLDALIGLNFQKILSQSIFAKVIEGLPIKLKVLGKNLNTQDQDMSFSSKLLTKLPDIVHPLKNELKTNLMGIANQQKTTILHKAMSLPEVQDYTKKLQTLKNELKKKYLSKGVDSLLKGILKKL